MLVRFTMILRSFVFLLVIRDITSELVCRNKTVDLVIAVDVSGSVTQSNFTNVRRLLRNLISVINVGSDVNETRVALITYNDDVMPAVWLDDFYTKEHIYHAISNIHKPDIGLTMTDKVIEYIHGKLADIKREAENIVMLITDGSSNNATKTADAARGIRNVTKLVVVGIDQGDLETMLEIASEPVDYHVYRVEQFYALDDVKRFWESFGSECELLERPSDE